MNNLQERVQKMLEGETKRRDVALKWIDEIKEILLPVSQDLWGIWEAFSGDPTNTITLSKYDENNKKKRTFIYFRYKDYEAMETEYVGFYDNTFIQGNTWGKPIEQLRGEDFWCAIQVIMEWLSQVIEMMDERENSRNALLDKIQ
jgi:hypothetical protein